ncbi:MAG TPA: hypothetical protein VM366_19825 [Anaerolineae bacterium]|nr:hypothetical protein [Anaerolineae bacterium]
MTRKASLVAGGVLVSMGLVALAVTSLLPLLGLRLWRMLPVWRLWPLTVISVGLGFVLPPLLYRGRRGLGGLFIPGVPVLVTGGILLFTSALNWWSAWAWLWPLEVLAVAGGFVLAALWLRVIWLLIPAMIIGANGLLFQFCALTGLWQVWAVMWAIEPLSVGLSLLLIGAVRRTPGLMTAGILLCSIGGIAIVGMSAILSATWLASWLWAVRLVVPLSIILVGVLLLIWGLTQRRVWLKTR